VTTGKEKTGWGISNKNKKEKGGKKIKERKVVCENCPFLREEAGRGGGDVN